MKNLLFSISIVLLSLVACVQAPKSDEAKVEEKKEVKAVPQTAESKKLTVDTQKSRVTWIGTKPTGRHTGTINIASGDLTVQGDDIKAGNFVMDMKSVKVMDMDEENNNNLAGHLMSDDFFKVEKFPQAKFVLTSIAPYKKVEGAEKPKMPGVTHTITGNLTLLKETKSISFPAKVTMSDKGLKATANFNIDRTDWGVSYGSDKSLGDKFIRPDVNLALNLVAK